MIDIPNLIKTLDKTGKVFRISFTGGGEPFLVRNIVDACVEITKKHYVSFNTNLTSQKIEEFCHKVNPEKVLFMVGSLHIKELERLNLMDKYIENYHLLVNKGIKVYSTEVGHPDILREAEKYRTFFAKNGIELGFNHFLGKHNGKKYPHSYTNEELKIIGGGDRKIHFPFGKLCNAGYNVAEVDINGNITTCGLIKENLGNIYQEIKLKNNIIRCPLRFCGCPLYSYDNLLYDKAIEENKTLLKKYFMTASRAINNILTKEQLIFKPSAKLKQGIPSYSKFIEFVKSKKTKTF